MTKFGETDNYKIKDFVEQVEEKIGKKISTILVNSKKPEEEILKKYKEQKAHFIEMDLGKYWDDRKIISEDFLDVSGDIVRHNPKKLKKVLEEIIL